MPSKMSLDELHEKFDTHLKNQSEKWKSLIYAKEKGFYQGYDELEIDGWRPTEKRFADYNIESYLSLEKSDKITDYENKLKLNKPWIFND